jgi:hypothetical protein
VELTLWRRRLRPACLVPLAIAATASGTVAQEVVGKRLFSDTLVIAEPFVEDELAPSFLRVLRPRNGEASRAWATGFDGEVKKRLTPALELSVGSGLLLLDPAVGASRSGAENVDIGLKYEIWRSEPSEAVASVALRWEIGGTGARVAGAEVSDTVRATFLAGQGFGNLPEALRLLRPFAVTGSIGAILPTTATSRTAGSSAPDSNPDRVQWGGVIEYSLLYLTTFVADVGLADPVKQFVPLVEMDFQTAVDRGAAGKTTGTFNLGAVWIGRAVQIVLIVDEIGYLPIDRAGANLFFQLISRRYERGPMILTSNQSFGSWGDVFGGPVIATAILDRVLHHAITINIRGHSYRLKDKLKAGLVKPVEATTT